MRNLSSDIILGTAFIEFLKEITLCSNGKSDAVTVCVINATPAKILNRNHHYSTIIYLSSSEHSFKSKSSEVSD
ncbi:hypothetical protein GJ496_003466 [Pomphorhynchus laevis]|nr:hypothetical protein GJ496_003466 [Pomphorhynchus laevis]